MKSHKSRRKSKYELRNQSLDLLNSTVGEIRESDSEARGKLQRELREVALDRIEKSARTQADFEKVVNIYDLMDSNRERKEREYEAYKVKFYKRNDEDEEMEYSDTPSFDTVFPTPFRFTLRTRYWRQILAGNFLDYIYDCKARLHEMTSRADLAEALKRLNNNQKEIFYSIAIEGKSPQEIAKYRGQTDRNIRKVYAGAIDSILKYLGK